MDTVQAKLPPHSRAFAARLLAFVALVAALATVAHAAESKPVKVAVYAFELDDFSAGGAYFAPDARDKSYLEQATAEAARQLAGSGRFAVIDTSGATDAPVKAHAMRSCSGCIGPITQRLGAEQAVLGVVTRINRTEYTLRVQFYDAGSGELRADYFTGLRMGANYTWPRGVASLMKSRILAAPETKR